MKETVFIEFSAQFPKTEWKRIYSADFLARKLCEELPKHGYIVTDDDLWEDFGWYLNFKTTDLEFSIFFAKYFDDEKWQLTLEFNNYPSLIKRILGARVPNYLNELKALAIIIYDVLSNSGHASDITFTLASNSSDEFQHPEQLKWIKT